MDDGVLDGVVTTCCTIQDVELSEPIVATGCRRYCWNQPNRSLDDSFIDDLQKLAAVEQASPSFVWLLPSSLQRLAVEHRAGRFSKRLTSHAEDATDHNLPLMYWYAMEPLADVDPPRALALALSAGEKIPILKEFMIRRIGAGDPEKSLALLVDGLKEAKDDATRLTFLRGMNESLKGRREVKTPAGWQDVLHVADQDRQRRPQNAARRPRRRASATTSRDRVAAPARPRRQVAPIDERRAGDPHSRHAPKPPTLRTCSATSSTTNPPSAATPSAAWRAFDDDQTPACHRSSSTPNSPPPSAATPSPRSAAAPPYADRPARRRRRRQSPDQPPHRRPRHQPPQPQRRRPQQAHRASLGHRPHLARGESRN